MLSHAHTPGRGKEEPPWRPSQTPAAPPYSYPHGLWFRCRLPAPEVAGLSSSRLVSAASRRHPPTPLTASAWCGLTALVSNGTHFVLALVMPAHGASFYNGKGNKGRIACALMQSGDPRCSVLFINLVSAKLVCDLNNKSSLSHATVARYECGQCDF